MTALVLASASPRRRELLGRVGLRFEVLPADIDEREHPGEAPEAFARRMAEEKAAAIAAQRPDAVVLAADTVVHLDDRIYGKPKDPEDAARILGELSDRWHVVTTGVCVRGPTGIRARAVSTRVRFRALSPALIAGYVATGEPSDKAGAYGIQGIGAALVEGIEGSYTNVVGLPLVEVLEDLVAQGAPHPLVEREEENP